MVQSQLLDDFGHMDMTPAGFRLGYGAKYQEAISGFVMLSGVWGLPKGTRRTGASDTCGAGTCGSPSPS
jgi:hypothetical protein